VQPASRLPRELGGYPGLAAVASHLTEFAGDRVQLHRSLLLLSGRLVACLSLSLYEQITCLPAGFSGDLPRLAGRSLDDLAAGLAGMLANLRGLLAGDVGSGRLGRWSSDGRRMGLRVLGHFPTCFLLEYCEAARNPRQSPLTSRAVLLAF
jgi:hypothetical protein